MEAGGTRPWECTAWLSLRGLGQRVEVEGQAL